MIVQLACAAVMLGLWIAFLLMDHYNYFHDTLHSTMYVLVMATGLVFELAVAALLVLLITKYAKRLKREPE